MQCCWISYPKHEHKQFEIKNPTSSKIFILSLKRKVNTQGHQTYQQKSYNHEGEKLPVVPFTYTVVEPLHVKNDSIQEKFLKATKNSYAVKHKY